MNPVFTVVTIIIGFTTALMGYFAGLAVFSPQKLKDYTRNTYDLLPAWWPARDMNLRLVENPSSFGLIRVVMVAAFLLSLAVFVFLLVAPSMPS